MERVHLDRDGTIISARRKQALAAIDFLLAIRVSKNKPQNTVPQIDIFNKRHSRGKFPAVR